MDDEPDEWYSTSPSVPTATEVLVLGLFVLATETCASATEQWAADVLKERQRYAALGSDWVPPTRTAGWAKGGLQTNMTALPASAGDWLYATATVVLGWRGSGGRRRLPHSQLLEYNRLLVSKPLSGPRRTDPGRHRSVTRLVAAVVPVAELLEVHGRELRRLLDQQRRAATRQAGGAPAEEPAEEELTVEQAQALEIERLRAALVAKDAKLAEEKKTTKKAQGARELCVSAVREAKKSRVWCRCERPWAQWCTIHVCVYASISSSVAIVVVMLRESRWNRFYHIPPYTMCAARAPAVTRPILPVPALFARLLYETLFT